MRGIWHAYLFNLFVCEIRYMSDLKGVHILEYMFEQGHVLIYFMSLVRFYECY